MLDRSLPFDLDAEAGVLGSLIIFPDCYDIVSLEVKPEDFFDDANRTLFECMTKLRDANKPLDITLIVHELQASGVLETIGGAAYIGKVASAVATPSNAAYYARIVREHAIRRATIHAAVTVTQDAYEASMAVSDLVGGATSAFADIGERLLAKRNGGGEVKEILHRAIDDLDARCSGQVDRYRTGLCGVDRIIGGLKKQQFAVIGARPGQGKSAMLLRIAHNMSVCAKPIKVLFVTLEMSESDLGERMLSMAGRVNSWKMQNGTLKSDDRKRIVEGAARYSKASLWIEDPGTITVSQIAAMCRLQARRWAGLDMVVIDYVQLIEPENVTRGESRQQQLGKITRKLKQLAKNQNLIVLSAAQLNRDVDRSGREPRLSDLREAGDIEQDTDVVMLCHMPGAENESKRAESPEHGEECKVLVRKNRNGPTGEACIYYFRAFSLWGDTAENEAKFTDPPPPPRFTEFDDYNKESGDDYGRF